MPLSHTDTIDDVKNSYWDNASYAETNSPTKCKAFITACRILLTIPTTTSTTEGRTESIQMDLVRIQNELNAAGAWLTQNDTTSGVNMRVKHLSFENYR